MPTGTFEYRSEQERVAIERAGATDPYRRVAALLHVLAHRR